MVRISGGWDAAVFPPDSSADIANRAMAPRWGTGGDGHGPMASTRAMKSHAAKHRNILKVR